MSYPVAIAGVISDAPRVATVMGDALQFLLSILGVCAIIGLVVAGILYLFSSGDERQIEHAKTATKYSIIGIAVALGALVILNAIAGFL
ncbi:MAG TPA: hypothetical protein VJL38_00055 [Patescibacteria group bacterium]|nr:hypothetical protein [Patescibacteria group bacterium]